MFTKQCSLRVFGLKQNSGERRKFLKWGEYFRKFLGNLPPWGGIPILPLEKVSNEGRIFCDAGSKIFFFQSVQQAFISWQDKTNIFRLSWKMPPCHLPPTIETL